VAITADNFGRQIEGVGVGEGAAIAGDLIAVGIVAVGFARCLGQRMRPGDSAAGRFLRAVGIATRDIALGSDVAFTIAVVGEGHDLAGVTAALAGVGRRQPIHAVVTIAFAQVFAEPGVGARHQVADGVPLLVKQVLDGIAIMAGDEAIKGKQGSDPFIVCSGTPGSTKRSLRGIGQAPSDSLKMSLPQSIS